MPSGKATYLGSLKFQISELPTFYVAEIETIVSGQPCLCRRLRASAVEDHLRKRLIDKAGRSQYSWVVNYRAKEGQLRPSVTHGPIDHLILRWDCLNAAGTREYRDEGDLTQVLHSGAEELYSPSLPVFRRDENGDRHESIISCRIRPAIRIISPHDQDDAILYHQCLDAYICSQAVNYHPYLRREQYNGCAKLSRKDWFANFPSTLGESPLDPIMDKLLYVAVRADPKVLLSEKALQLDFDLALGINGQTRVSKLLCQYLGNKVLGPGCIDILSRIKSLLLGLEVKARYTRKSSKKKLNPDHLRPEVESPESPRMVTPSKLRVISKSNLGTQSLARNTPRGSRVASTATLYEQSPARNIPGGSRVTSISTLYERLPALNLSTTPKVYFTDTGLTDHGPYRILDIKMPSDVPHIVFEGSTSQNGDEEKHEYSVAEYFAKVNDTVLQYPHMPYAKVRRNTWIPLELLYTHQDQLLRKTGQLTDLMSIHVERFCKDVENKPEDQLFSVSKTLHVDHDALPDILDNTKPTYLAPVDRPVREVEKLESLSTNDPHSSIDATRALSILYFPSAAQSPVVAAAYRENITRRAIAQRNGLRLRLGSLSKTIWTEGLLSLDTHTTDLEGRTGEVILCIIDESHRTKAEVEDIRAECYRVAHLSLGCFAVCVSKQDLDRSVSAYASLPDRSTHFPQTIVQKINYMIGRSNHRPSQQLHLMNPLYLIQDDLLELQREIESDIDAKVENKFGNKGVSDVRIAKYRENLRAKNSVLRVERSAQDLQFLADAMIVGAHIAQPDSNAAVDCPSVAAIVASNRASTHYYGSARIQETMNHRLSNGGNAAQTKSRQKKIVQSQIVGLKAMMYERLLARGQKSDVPIIFFRGGSVDGEDVANEELADIERAWCDFYEDECTARIAYITVSRRSRADGFDQKTDNNSFAIGKYQYKIHRDDLELDSQIWLNFVKRLNDSNQMGGTVSMALPIHFAQKLAKRVFSYFRFYNTNSASTYPEVLREISLREKYGKEHRMSVFMQQILGLGDRLPTREGGDNNAWKSRIFPSPLRAQSPIDSVLESPRQTQTESSEDDGDDSWIGEENEDTSSFGVPWAPCLDNTMFYL